ncbi:hypothetical protein [Acidithiobacillus sp.]
MGILDYLIGKNIGEERARIDTRSAENDAHRARIDAIRANKRADLMTKRFYRERQERRNWQLTAVARKLSMMQMGMTEAQVIAKQREILADPILRAEIDQDLDAETADIDAETIMQETNNPSSQ